MTAVGLLDGGPYSVAALFEYSFTTIKSKQYRKELTFTIGYANGLRLATGQT